MAALTLSIASCFAIENSITTVPECNMVTAFRIVVQSDNEWDYGDH